MSDGKSDTTQAENSFLPQKVRLGDFFPSRPGLQKDRIIKDISVGDDDASAISLLTVTPSSEIVITGENLGAYDSAAIITATNEPPRFIPGTITHKPTLVSIEFPDYGSREYNFRLLLNSSQPNVSPILLTQKFVFKRESEKEKDERKRKASEAKDRQAEAEESFERAQEENVRSAGAVTIKAGAEVLSGIAAGAIAAAGSFLPGENGENTPRTEEEELDRIVHAWPGSKSPKDSHEKNGVGNIRKNVISGGGQKDEINSTSNTTSSGQSPVVHQWPGKKEKTSQTTTASAGSLSPSSAERPSGLQEGAENKGRVDSAAANIENKGVPASANPRTEDGSLDSANVPQSNKGESKIASKIFGGGEKIKQPGDASVFGKGEQVGRRVDGLAGVVSRVGSVRGGKLNGKIVNGSQRGEAPSQSTQSGVSGNISSNTNVNISGSSKGSVGVNISGSSNMAGAAVTESVGEETIILSTNEVSEKASVNSVLGGLQDEPLAEGAGPELPKGQSGILKGNPAEPFKNKKDIKLEQEYKAKFAEFQRNEKNLNVKFRIPSDLPGVGQSGKRKGSVRGEQASPRTRRDSSSSGERLSSQEGVSAGTLPDASDSLDSRSAITGVPLSEGNSKISKPEFSQGSSFSPIQSSDAVQNTGLSSQVQPVSEESGESNFLEQNSPSQDISPVQKKKSSKKSELPEDVEKAVGTATSEWWWAGFGVAAAVFFSGFDFLLGAIIMDGYWIAHARKPTLFPMKKWQKGVTVFANISPFLFAALFVVLVITVACNMPVYKYIISGVSTVTGNGAGICSNFDISKLGSSSSMTGAQADGGDWKNVGAGVCQPLSSGPASVTNLSQSCFGSNAPKASAIAAAESGGNPTSESRSDKCADGNSVSIGLFQINLTNHPMGGLNCPAAFTKQYTGSDRSCIVKTDASSQALYQNCVAAAKDPSNNIQEACTISRNGQSWNQWGANNKCGF
jgi:hypothetical protein